LLSDDQINLKESIADSFAQCKMVANKRATAIALGCTNVSLAQSNFKDENLPEFNFDFKRL
jgi:hypothetical protein